MNPVLTPLTPIFGYIVDGIDLSEALTPAVETLFRGAMATRGLLLFREQSVDETQQVRFARTFGKISKQGPVQQAGPDATYVSNVRKDGTFGDGELHFHSDQTYYPHPMKAIMLFGIEIPKQGGETLFSSAVDAVKRMPAQLRERLKQTRVLNRLDYGRLKLGDSVDETARELVAQAWHPAITRHPYSGQTIHMISPDTSKQLENVSPQEAFEIIDAVREIVADPEHVYRHQWRAGDLIVWDNMLMQHARSTFEPTERRTLRRCAIGGDQKDTTAETRTPKTAI